MRWEIQESARITIKNKNTLSADLRGFNRPLNVSSLHFVFDKADSK